MERRIYNKHRWSSEAAKQTATLRGLVCILLIIFPGGYMPGGDALFALQPFIHDDAARELIEQ
eukprot:scaffold529320_cov53-Prasinocladus_malaysianus.AAC.1